MFAHPATPTRAAGTAAAGTASRRSLIPMDNALGPGQPHEAGGTDDQLTGRYVMGARLSHDGKVQTFRATDRWLHRPVVMVFDTGSGGRALTETCQAMAGVLSPNLVGIYDRGGNASYHFVVCEYPTSTVAALAQQSDRSLWNEGRAIDTAKQLAVALSDLHRSGVDTSVLHLGSIGIDESGRVRLSPWPLAASPGAEGGVSTPASELELVAWVLESGAYPAKSSMSAQTADLAARLRQKSGEGAALTLDQLLGALDRLAPSAYDKPTGEVPVVTGAVSVATGVVPVTTGAVPFSHDTQSHMYRPRRLRARWPVAAGAGIAALAALLVISLGSSNSPVPAAATSNATGSCVSNAKSCPTSGNPQSPSGTVAAPNIPGTSVSGSDAAATSPDATSPVDTTPTTAVPSTTTTSTTTTTVAPSTTTTTAPESTTTTSVPSTTTTTAASAASSGNQSAAAQP